MQSAATLRLPSAATQRPALWDELAARPAEYDVAGWRAWRRKKGAGYWLMRWATRLSNALCRLERRLGRDAPEAVTNPNGLEDCGTVETEDEAKDLCRILFSEGGGRWAVTYEPIIVGRVYGPRTEARARGDRRFDPFKAFDFSATAAVREQATRQLVESDKLARLLAAVERMAERTAA